MWPIPSGLLIKLGALALAAAAIWAYGFSVGSNGKQKQIDKAKSEAAAIQIQESVKLLNTINETRVNYEKAIGLLNGSVATLNASVRNRANRQLPGAAPVGAGCTAATGNELSRQDAEFLIRYASDAAKVTEKLNFCFEENDALRAAMLGKQR